MNIPKKLVAEEMMKGTISGSDAFNDIVSKSKERQPETYDEAKEWSIYNNTKPLSELSDEQRGLLLSMLCSYHPMQYKFKCRWEDRPKSSSLINTHTIYRAKQKSERELFIDAADYFIDCGDDPARIAGKMFDAGFKAPKVGE